MATRLGRDLSVHTGTGDQEEQGAPCVWYLTWQTTTKSAFVFVPSESSGDIEFKSVHLDLSVCEILKSGGIVWRRESCDVIYGGSSPKSRSRRHVCVQRSPGKKEMHQKRTQKLKKWLTKS